MWAPDGQSFVTGCLDTERNLCQWNLNGGLIYDWGQNHRIQDLAISPDGSRLVAMENVDHVYIYNFATRELEYEINLKVKLVSVAVSQNSQHLLVNKNDGESRMFDLDSRETVRVFNSGDRQAKYIIRAAFGGANESFVITGSEGMFKKRLIKAYDCTDASAQMVTSISGTRITEPLSKDSTDMTTRVAAIPCRGTQQTLVCSRRQAMTR